MAFFREKNSKFHTKNQKLLFQSLKSRALCNAELKMGLKSTKFFFLIRWNVLLKAHG